MGDWVKAEFALARQLPERDYAASRLRPRAPYIVQAMHSSSRRAARHRPSRHRSCSRASSPPPHASRLQHPEGSIPIRPDVDLAALDVCARKGIAILKDKSRVVGNDEIYLTPIRTALSPTS